MAAPVRTTCPYCGVGCGVAVSAGAAVAGDGAHSANYGRLCSKGSALGETLAMPGRLLYPSIDGRRACWDDALDLIAARFSETIARHGSDSVAFYVSGQLLTEDYYVANKLMKGFIGSGNIDTNSRLCMASSVAGHRRAFGEDVVPGCYEDLERADLVVLVGSNLAWCHPVLYRRLMDARAQRGTKIVVVDPRRTASCDDVDLHLQIAPGSDVMLFNGLLAYLWNAGALDTAFVMRATRGFGAALETASVEAGDLRQVAGACGVPLAELETFYAWFAATDRTVTVYSQGVNQSTRGTDKVNAIINCHLATGRIGKEGAGPFSITGQPNAMGGREVGGLANQLAAHMVFESAADLDRVARFWNAPNLARAAGLKAVDMMEAVSAGKIRAIWIMGTNPAVSLPDAGRVARALEECAFVVVSDCLERTDTAAFADVLLPAQSWGEKDGTVTNSERTISRQRSFRPARGEARPDWWALSEVAKRMGHAAAFAYQGPCDIFLEHARLSAFENEGARVFDLSGLTGLDAAGYDAMVPVQWPVNAAHPGGARRLFADERFPASDGRAQFLAVNHIAPAHKPSAHFPLLLNTGRLRDQWHTMSHTGAVPRLCAHTSEPRLAIHPHDAEVLSLDADDLVRVISAKGGATARVQVTDEMAPGHLFLPMHWNNQFTADCVAGRLIHNDTDAVSGQPELKNTPVRVEKLETAWTAFWLRRTPGELQDIPYWTRIRIDGGYLYELAGTETGQQATALWETFAGAAARDVEYYDARRGAMRWARLDRSGVLCEAFFAGPPASLPERDWLTSLFASQGALEGDARQVLLRGRPADATPAKGRTICACFNIGAVEIAAAIREHGLCNVRTIGQQLKAGTNCGSCIPEIKEMIAHESRVAAE